MKLTFLFLFFISAASAAENPSADALPADSIYQVEARWTFQDGREFAWSELRGKPVVVTMVYTGCEYACPMTVNKLQEIEKALEARGYKDYRIVMASFDPEKDRPGHLKEYMKKRKITGPRWSMAVAPDAPKTRELAILLGVNYKAEEGGHFSHSNVITLLDRQGRVLSQVNGLNADIKPLVEAAVKDGSGS